MELAQQCVPSLQGIAEGDRVAPSIGMRGRSSTAVGTHDVDFLIARHKAQHAERFPSFHEGSLLVGRRRVSRRSTCRSCYHTPDERRWSHEKVSRGLPLVKLVAPRSLASHRRPPGDHGSAHTGHRVRDDDADWVEDQ